MVSGWTPINRPVNQPYSSQLQTTFEAATGEVPINSSGKKKKPRSTKSKASKKTATGNPRKRSASSNDGASRKRKKPTKPAITAVEDGNQSAAESISSDMQYGLDEPFPDIDISSDIALPIRQIGNESNRHQSQGYPPTTNPGCDGSAEHTSGSEDTVQNDNQGWSDSTAVTNFMYDTFTFSDLAEEPQESDPIDSYGDLDDEDLACLDLIRSDDASVPVFGPANHDFVDPSQWSVTVPEVSSSPVEGVNINDEPDHTTVDLQQTLSSPLRPSSQMIEGSASNEAAKSTTLFKPFKTPFERKPIIRPRFPNPTRDRSPVTGVSPTTILRTCFRIGEAINVGSRAIREHKDVVIEIFARVKSSEREVDGVKQHFVLLDLYHDRPPHLPAIYDLWKDNDIWERESGVFLEQRDSKMCRCVGRMKKDDKQKLIFLVLSIWEATWKNVDYTKGIVCKASV